MTLRRTKTQRRSRPRRERGKGGVGLPNRGRTQDKPYEWKESDIETLRELHAQRSYVAQKTDEHLIAPIAPSPSHWIKHPGEYDVYGVDYPGWKIKKQMEKRSDAAQATDRALKAPLAPTPEEWMKHPEMYDLPDVDTPQKTKAKPPRVDEQKNPMGTPNAAKDYLADVVESYRKRLGVKGDVKLHAQKNGYPARIIHSPDGKPSQIMVNYRHFGIMWEHDPELTKKYLEYAVAHEMAHQKQIEEIGFRGALKADKEAKSEVEVDADHRAYKAMGVSEDAMGKVMDKLAVKVGGEHVKKHAHYKGTPNLSRFKDLSPVEKPEPEKRSLAEIQGEMKVTYGKALAGILPGSTQHERELITEKAISEKWIKPGDTAKTIMAQVTEKARAELVKIRQEKAAKDREEQLKALKERADQAHAKKTDEQRLREQLSLRREEYGVQYDAYLGGALSQWAANKRDSLYTALKNMGYSDLEAGQISHSFNGDSVKRIQAEALTKARKEAMDVADDAYGELTGLWNEAIQKNMTAEAAERHAQAAVEAAYNDTLGSVRDRTKSREADSPYNKAKRIILAAKTPQELDGIMKAVYHEKDFTDEEKTDLAEYARARHGNMPAPKPTVKTSSESYDFYADPGHGWLRVPVKRLEELGIENDISPYSYVKGSYAYLEEDRDARIFTDTLESLGVKVGLREHTANRESSIRGYQPYVKPKQVAHYNEATEQIVKRVLDAGEGITRAEVERLIAAKQEAAAGLLTEEAAATLVASDLSLAKTPATMSPTEEARKRYDETIADRVPRMARTAKLDLRKALLDQGFTVEEANIISDRLTAEAVHQNQSDFILQRRMSETPAHLTPEIKAERDSLVAVQNEYEKLKKEALEDWAIARRKVTAISQSPEIKRIVEGYKTEQPQDDLPSLKKATAFSPEYSKDSGMYEVEVYNPETGRKSTRKFSTPDKAEQYRRLINENPGWPLEGFKERQGNTQGKPKYLIIARNVKSRGDEAIAYTVYDRDKSDRNNQNMVNRGTIEYKEAPGKDKIVEDLILEAPKGTSYEVEFTVTPHWTPALSEVERIAPARPGDRDGKWMVWFKNRVGRDMDLREGMGTRSFDTHGEALDFIKEGRGRYNQGDFEREGIWLTVPKPPTLPSELESFLGKQAKFLVDPRPRYEGTWNPDRKAMEYRWVWENQIGGQTHTLDELKEERQKGEWKTRDRVEAAKSSRTLTKDKGAKSKDWDREAQPLASAIVFTENAVIEAEGDKVTYEGMDGSHVALLRLMGLPNDMGVPDGKYEVADFNLDGRVTHLRHPKKLEWDNVERTLKVANENQESYIRYEKVHEFQNRFPVPKVIHQAETKLDMEALKKAVDGGPHIEHIALKVKRGIGPYGDTFTYEATARENQKVTQVGDDGVPWESEEWVDVPLTGSVGEVKHVSEDEVKTTYTTSYLSENLEKLMRAGFRDATLEFATDMPLKITAKRDDGAEAEFWLAPCIGV